MENKKVEIGSFTNDGLASGFPEFNVSDKKLEQLRDFIKQQETELSINAKQRIKNLSKLLIAEFSMLPNDEDFAKWLFDNLKIANNDNTDFNLKIFEYTKFENNRLKKSIKSNERKIVRKSFGWLGTEEQLIYLHQELTNDFLPIIEKETEYELI